MEQLEIFEKFIQDALAILEKNDDYEIELLKQETKKLIKNLRKEKYKQLFLNSILRFYYLILNNDIYLTLNKVNIKMLKYELANFLFIYRNIKEKDLINDTNFLAQIFQILNNLFLYDNCRIQYILNNYNPGRIAIYNYEIVKSESIESANEELKRELSQKLIK